MVEQRTIVNIFCCYAHKDKALQDELIAHLSLLNSSGRITIWSDKEISPGAEWEKEIADHLNSADIILLLISVDFVASYYCYHTEMKRALERHIRGEARVIPIVGRSVDFEEAPFSKLEMLPTKAKPIALWPDKDEALTIVARGVRQAVKEVALERLQVTNHQALTELGLVPQFAEQDNIRLIQSQPRTGDKLNIGPPQSRTTNEEIPASGLTPGAPPASPRLKSVIEASNSDIPSKGGGAVDIPSKGRGPMVKRENVTRGPMVEPMNGSRPAPVEPMKLIQPASIEEAPQYSIPQPLEPDETVSFLQSLFQIFRRHRQVRQGLTGPTPQPQSSDEAIYTSKIDGQPGDLLVNRPVVNLDGSSTTEGMLSVSRSMDTSLSFPELTHREREVVALLVQGQNNKEIAQKLLTNAMCK